MTPNNPPESDRQQQIVTIVDKDNVNHKVIPVNHTHSQSEVSGLTTALAGKMDAKTIDSAPANNADHLVSSKGVYDALQNKADINSPASSITNGDGASVNFSQNGDIVLTPKSGRNVAFMFNGSATAVSPSNAENLARALQTPDSTPTANSDNLVTSGGVYDAIDGLRQDTDHYLEGKMDNKTIDSTPSNNANNLVSSKGVYDALALKADDVNVRYNEFEKADTEEVIDLDEVFGDDHMVSHFILQNLTNASCNISDFFTATNANILDNGETVQQYAFAIVKVVMYDNGSTTSYFVVVDGIYEM